MQEVFEKIIEELEIERTTANNTFVKYEMNVDLGRVFGLEKAIEIVKQEAEKCNNGWIPCSERLPKVEDLHEKSLDNCTCYLIQRRCGIMDVAHYIKVYGESYFEANSIKMIDVVAWRPLPDPYQPKGE